MPTFLPSSTRGGSLHTWQKEMEKSSAEVPTSPVSDLDL
jgi:hypothetical protein